MKIITAIRNKSSTHINHVIILILHAITGTRDLLYTVYTRRGINRNIEYT